MAGVTDRLMQLGTTGTVQDTLRRARMVLGLTAHQHPHMLGLWSQLRGRSVCFCNQYVSLGGNLLLAKTEGKTMEDEKKIMKKYKWPEGDGETGR